jgi:hypothetical protein
MFLDHVTRSDAELILDRLQRSTGSMVVTQLRMLGDADGKVICVFQAASKFGVRYATFGFQPDAKLDEGNIWATSFALIKLTAAEEAKIIALLKKAVS